MLLSPKRCIIEFLSTFDGRTTALLVAIAFFIQAAVIGTQAFLIREYKGISTALFGNLSMAIGFTLLLLRNILPDIFTIVIANSLVLTSPNLYYIAVSRFSRQKYSPSLSILIIILNAFLLIFFTYTSENVAARIMSVSILGALSTFLTVKQLWNLRLTAYKFSVALMAIPLSIYCIFLLVRVFDTFFHPPTTLFSNNPVEIATYIFLFIISFLWTIGFMLMISQRLQSDLWELANTDTLTRIPNRHATQNFIAKEYARVKRRGGEFSVLLIDIDNFKQLNDIHGHAVGDQALTSVAKIFALAIRKQDIAGRWGGEEFLMILPDTSVKDTLSLAKRIRNSISKIKIDKVEPPIQLTISVGIASSQSCLSTDEILKKADDALYVAKETKDTVIAAK